MGNNCCTAGDKPLLLRQETLDFIVEKTNATHEDVEEQHKNFIQQYPDGKIDPKGFRVMMNKCFPDQDIERLAKHIFRMYDRNEDGKIDFAIEPSKGMNFLCFLLFQKSFNHSFLWNRQFNFDRDFSKM